MANLGQFEDNNKFKYVDAFINSPLPKLGEVNLSPKATSGYSETSRPRLATNKVDYSAYEKHDISDYARTFGAGVVGVGQGVTELGRKIGLVPEELATSIQRGGQKEQERLYSKMSKSFREKATQPMILENKEGENKPFYERFNPEYSGTTLLHDLTASAPGIIAMGGAGGVVGKGATKVLSPLLERMGIGETVSTHFPTLSKLADTVFPEVGSSASKVNKLIAMSVGMRGGQAASEGLLTASQNSSDARLKVLDTPIESFNKNPLFHEKVNSQDPSIPLSQRQENARKELADMAADDVFSETFKSTAGIAALTGGGVLGDIAAKTGKISNAIHKTLIKEGVKEGLAQELPQSYNEQLIGNIAYKKYVDPDYDVLTGTLDAALKGAATGAVMGAGMGGVSHISDTLSGKPNEDKKKLDSTRPDTNTEWKNKDVQKSYNYYTSFYSKNPDPTSPEYNDIYSATKSNLESIINPGEGKEQKDAVKVEEAKAALRSVEAAHTSLNNAYAKEQEAQKLASEELQKSDSSEQTLSADEVGTTKKREGDKVVTKEGDTAIVTGKSKDGSGRVTYTVKRYGSETKKSVAEKDPQSSMSVEELTGLKLEELSDTSKQRLVEAGELSHEDINRVEAKGNADEDTELNGSINTESMEISGEPSGSLDTPEQIVTPSIDDTVSQPELGGTGETISEPTDSTAVEEPVEPSVPSLIQPEGQVAAKPPKIDLEAFKESLKAEEKPKGVTQEEVSPKVTIEDQIDTLTETLKKISSLPEEEKEKYRSTSESLRSQISELSSKLQQEAVKEKGGSTAERFKQAQYDNWEKLDPRLQRVYLKNKFKEEDLRKAAINLFGSGVDSMFAEDPFLDYAIPLKDIEDAVNKVKSKEESKGVLELPTNLLTPKQKELANKEVASGNYNTFKTKIGNDVKVVVQKNKDEIIVHAYDSDNNRIGLLSATPYEESDGQRWNPSVHVEEKWRRQGVATKLYDIAEEHGALIPDVSDTSQVRSEDGQKFREARAGISLSEVKETPTVKQETKKTSPLQFKRLNKVEQFDKLTLDLSITPETIKNKHYTYSDRIIFHLYNPNGIIGQLNKEFNTLFDLVNKRKLKSGHLLSNNYDHIIDRFRKLKESKRPNVIEYNVTLKAGEEALEDIRKDIKKGNEVQDANEITKSTEINDGSSTLSSAQKETGNAIVSSKRVQSGRSKDRTTQEKDLKSKVGSKVTLDLSSKADSLGAIITSRYPDLKNIEVVVVSVTPKQVRVKVPLLNHEGKPLLENGEQKYSKDVIIKRSLLEASTEPTKQEQSVPAQNVEAAKAILASDEIPGDNVKEEITKSKLDDISNSSIDPYAQELMERYDRAVADEDLREQGLINKEYKETYGSDIPDKVKRESGKKVEDIVVQSTADEIMDYVDNESASFHNEDGSIDDLFSFAGERSNTANLQTLETVKKLIREGRDPEELRQEYGWFKGVDGKWRYEIDDSDAHFKINLEDLEESPLFGDPVIYSLQDVLVHPQLFNAYPFLNSIKFIKQKGFLDFGGLQGSFTPSTNTIKITPYASDPLSTLLHEIQHVIQTIEVFAKGGNEQSVLQAISPERLQSIAEGLHNSFLEKAERLRAEYELAKKVIEHPLYNSFLDAKLKETSAWHDHNYFKEDFPELSEQSKKESLSYGKEVDTILRRIANDLGFSGTSHLPIIVYRSSDVKAGDTLENTISNKKAAVNNLLMEALGEMDKVAIIRSGDREAILALLKKSKGLFELYESLAGEVEARNVQARQQLTMEERLRTPISQTQSVKDEDVIITFKDPGDSESRVSKENTQVETNRTIFNNIINNYLSDKIKDIIQFKFVDNFQTYDWVVEENVHPSRANLYSTGGGVVRTLKDGSKILYMHGNQNMKDFIGTFMHELVGHIGLRELFKMSMRLNRRVEGRDAYDNFLINLINTNLTLRNAVLQNFSKWSHYLSDWQLSNGYYSIVTDSNGNQKRVVDWEKYKLAMRAANPKDRFRVKLKDGRELYIPAEVAVRYADEHMAEIAKEVINDDKFMENAVGIGGRSERSAKSKLNRKLLDRFLDKLKHFFRVAFGKYVSDITTDDLRMLVASSYDYVFSRTFTMDSLLRDSFELHDINNVITSTNTDDLGESESFSMRGSVEKELGESVLDPEIMNSIDAFNRNLNSGFGEVSKLASSRWYKKVEAAINRSPLLSSMKALGNMSSQDYYNHIQNVFKGEIGKIQNRVDAFIRAIGPINSLQNAVAFDYFTTKGATEELLKDSFSELQIAIIKKAKTDIEDLGKLQVKHGLLSQEAYDKYEGAYLHRTYLDYIREYRGSGKRTSFMSHLQKRKDKSDLARLALGEIRDIRFLLADTIGTVGRDTVLIQMFETLNKASESQDLYWTLTSNETVEWLGTKLTIDQAIDQINRNETLIPAFKKWMEDDKKLFEKTGKHLDNTFPFRAGDEGAEATYNRLKEANKLLIESVADIENKALDKAFKSATLSGSFKGDNRSDFLEKHYIRLPNEKRFGALKNKYVRKEIANDLDAFANIFSNRDNMLEQLLGRGGMLERINQMWKLSMVGLNPASHFRNIVGNFVLLDLSTPTNKGKLMTMLLEEVISAWKGNPSKFWQMAIDYGLFGTTFSAAELQTYFRLYGDDLEAALAEHRVRTKSDINNQMFFASPGILAFGKLLSAHTKEVGHTVQSKASSIFANLEGAFKTIALRDYVELWEKQNGRSLDDLNDVEKRVVLSKAATHANKNLFDYSQVPSLIKYARRIPFGSPFLTYSYKAFPVILTAALNNPIKFAEYLALPSLVTAVSALMNDWDDDDLDKFKRSLNDHLRTNPMVAFIPFKDSKGQPQVLPLDYMFPWSQSFIAARRVAENYMNTSGESVLYPTLQSAGTLVNEFGFTGGPVPSVFLAMKTGNDDFTGRAIANPGESPDQQILSYMKYSWDLAVPSWLSSHGWLNKMYKEFGISKPELDRFGDVKFTPGQTLAEITGFRATSVNVSHGLANRRKGFEYQLKEIAEYRSSIVKDRNLDSQTKALKLRDIATRMKLVRTRMAEETKL